MATPLDNNTFPIERNEDVDLTSTPLFDRKPLIAPKVDPLPVSKGKKFSKDLLGSVVKIFSVHTEPNYSMPWQMKRQKKATSSGFVISERRIVTNAHSVVHHTSVLVRKHGCAKKFTAEVLAEGHDCDLALITVKDESFWEGLVPLEFGEIPNLQDSVIVAGYPTGGDNISVTCGVVSRIDYVHYSHGASKLLAIQIDAAINSGNSGGPAIKGNKVVGVSFETLVNAENIGYLIPSVVILHFLEDIKRHKKYTGFCEIGLVCQSMENPHIKHYLKMEENMTGLFVNRVDPLASSSDVIKKNDVLLAIDNVDIADDCTVVFREDERISFKYLLLTKFLEDEALLTVFREGKINKLSVKLRKSRLLVPLDFDTIPSYFIYAGLVFVPLTQLYLRHQWGKQWDKKAPVRLCDIAINGELQQVDQEIVILSQVLVHDVNIGYQHINNIQIKTFNGITIRNLKHLVSLVEASNSGFMRFDLDFDRTIILDRLKAQEATSEIMKQHSIACSKSEDILLSKKSIELLSIPTPTAPAATIMA